VIIGLSKSEAEENTEAVFLKDLAVFFSRMPFAMVTTFGNIVKAFDEELNDSNNINGDAKATIKYFLGKLVRSLNVFFDIYEKPVLKNYIISPGNLIMISEALEKTLRAYRLLVTEDLNSDGTTVNNIASYLEDASALIERVTITAISELTEKLASSNCVQQLQGS